MYDCNFIKINDSLHGNTTPKGTRGILEIRFVFVFMSQWIGVIAGI